MSVKIIRAHRTADYSQKNNKKVRIEFKDGSFMVGFININSKFIGNELQDDEPDTYQSIENSKFKFNRVSDYLKRLQSERRRDHDLQYYFWLRT